MNPSYGGWGGRYVLYQPFGETRPIWSNNQDSRDTVELEPGHVICSDQATIWRWREHYQHDFAARMDWCVAQDFKQANHNPVAVLNGDTSQRVLELAVKSGDQVRLSAAGSSDPDSQEITATWFAYREAGTFAGEVRLSGSTGEVVNLIAPVVTEPKTIHVILQVQDDGVPSLYAYRRVVVTVTP